MEINVVKQIVEEELSLARDKIFARLCGIGNVGNQVSAANHMKLEFRNKVPGIILTGDVIRGEGDTPIQVVLTDDITGNVIDAGPYASARVEIVVLKGDFDASGGDNNWTVKEFNDNIVTEKRGKKPFLGGNVLLRLRGGIAVLEAIRFRNDASKIKPPLFRLAARVVDTFEGVRIMEAMTESFTVKIYRDKYFRKHKIPAALDDVYRLKNIRKHGNIHKNLQANGIRTVEDFLIQHLKDPEELKSVVLTLGAKKLEAAINHAQTCPIVERMYCYIDIQEKRAIVFTLLGQALGIYGLSQGALINTLPETNKAEVQDLLASAYGHLEDTSYFVDDDSLHSHLTSVLLPNYLSSGLHNNGTFNVIGESSNTRMEPVLTVETTGDGMGTVLGTTIMDDCGRMLATMTLSNEAALNSPIPNYNCFLLDEPFYDVGFVESLFANHIPKAPKRWKRLFCVSRLSYRVRKKMQRV